MSNQPLKVVHISTYAFGGAGNAAYRIHEAMIAKGISSQFICLHPGNNQNLKAVFVLQQPFLKHSFYNKIVIKIKWRLKAHLNVSLDIRAIVEKKYNSVKQELNCEYASLPFTGNDILADPNVQNADIIHLHWVAGMLDYPSFFNKNTKPVVWTLHDMNPFQGIFHYKEDELRNVSISSSLDLQVLDIKRKSINKSKKKLRIVCPSEWLLKSAMQSNTFKRANGQCIPYPLNMDIFTTVKDSSLRQQLNIPVNTTVFLFVAQNVSNYRKGFDILLEALKNIDRTGLTLLVIGHKDKLDIPGLDVRILGTIEDNLLLRNYYSIADAFIISSREDNLPNVMLESMACGTPVLSFDIGGMAEFIIDGFNGLKAKTTAAKELVEIMNKFIQEKDTYDSYAIRKFALENFSNDIVVKQYKEVYSAVLKSKA